jgi:hypothetical protein
MYFTTIAIAKRANAPPAKEPCLQLCGRNWFGSADKIPQTLTLKSQFR